MLDIVKYSSLEFRQHEGQCIPRGPSFERAKSTEVLLPQCTLKFRAPRHAPYRRHPSEQYMVAPGRLRDLKDFSPIGRVVPSDSWREAKVCYRTWAFYGPWFTGYMGAVNFSMEVVETTKVNSAVNFLYPPALESAIQGFITAYHGHELYDEVRLTPYYVGPINWGPIVGLGVPAVTFDIEECFSYGRRYRYVLLPVSANRMLVIRFAYRQSGSGSWEEIDAKVSPQPMIDLIQNIISSIRMTPSPELQVEIDKAKAACQGIYSVSPECQPFKWPADVDKDGLTILEYRKDRYKG